uniref:Nudix hydrolase domain-containing protein n=1 Tax=Heterorhabditis bacteriophora TaxID=37862 RepID=A0A1I7X3V8_HETBA
MFFVFIRLEWYMPAGRVEAGETLEDSVQREVKEETGYDCEVMELLSLQVQGSGWYRFAFYCHLTGGELKTTADQESLSAQWWSVKDENGIGKISGIYRFSGFEAIPNNNPNNSLRIYLKLIEDRIYICIISMSEKTCIATKMYFPPSVKSKYIFKILNDSLYRMGVRMLRDDEHDIPKSEWFHTVLIALVITICFNITVLSYRYEVWYLDKDMLNKDADKKRGENKSVVVDEDTKIHYSVYRAYNVIIPEQLSADTYGFSLRRVFQCPFRIPVTRFQSIRVKTVSRGYFRQQLYLIFIISKHAFNDKYLLLIYIISHLYGA